MCREYVVRDFESKIECLTKTMRRLQRLLQARIIFNDDILYFTFKKHIFTGKIAQGGLIWNCTWQKPGELSADIFKHTTALGEKPYIRTFESLTDWTETCIQECLDEYHTRYSSWKRVRHRRSDQPMEVLFKHLQLRQLTPSADPGNKHILLFEQIASQKGHIETLTEHIHSWNEWFKQKFPNEKLPIAPLVPETEQLVDEPSAQPFMLHSNEGQYVVLHRLNEVAPEECISWLKQNGPESFRNRLTGVKLTFEPSTGTSEVWNPVDKETGKQFVHHFFNA